MRTRFWPPSCVPPRLADTADAESPCQIANAAKVVRRFEPKPAAPEQIAVIVENMPDKCRALILIAAWCGLRWGEVSELRRKDLALRAMSVRVEPAVVWRKGQPSVGRPKSRAGVRTVAMPPNLRPALTRHLKEHAMPGEDGLLFPNAARTGHLHVNTLSKTYTVLAASPVDPNCACTTSATAPRRWQPKLARLSPS